MSADTYGIRLGRMLEARPSWLKGREMARLTSDEWRRRGVDVALQDSTQLREFIDALPTHAAAPSPRSSGKVERQDFASLPAYNHDRAACDLERIAGIETLAVHRDGAAGDVHIAPSVRPDFEPRALFTVE